MPASPAPAVLRALAAELKARRAELGFSQEALAHEAGLTPSFIARMETGNNQPSLTVVFQLAQALGLSPGEFVNGVAARYRKEKRQDRQHE